MQKYTLNGIEGFWLPMSGYRNLLLILNDYLFLQEKYAFLENENMLVLKKLGHYEIVRTSLAISIAIAITEFFLCGALGFFCYAIAKY
jgi:hypothetical protein